MNNPRQITTTNDFEPLRQAGIKGNSRHETKEPAVPPIFVPGTTVMQRHHELATHETDHNELTNITIEPCQPSNATQLHVIKKEM
jgi:hypothetical protein